MVGLANFSVPLLELARTNGLLPAKKLELGLAFEHEEGQHTYTLIKLSAFLNLVSFLSLVLGSSIQVRPSKYLILSS